MGGGVIRRHARSLFKRPITDQPGFAAAQHLRPPGGDFSLCQSPAPHPHFIHGSFKETSGIGAGKSCRTDAGRIPTLGHRTIGRFRDNHRAIHHKPPFRSRKDQGDMRPGV